MKSPIILLLALLTMLPTAQSEEVEEVVFSALPDSRVRSGAEKTSREILGERKQNESRLLITKKGKEYFWKTRENRRLVHSVSGAFHIFTDPRGSGYIKIFDSSLLPESLREPGPKYSYLEHIHLHLGTITYWGKAATLKQ